MTELGFSTSNIIDAISVSIDGVLNAQSDSVSIYSENIEQGFSTPCIYIKLISHNQNKLVNLRWVRYYHFDIHYFPSSGTAGNAEMENIADILVPALGDISNGDYKYHGIGISTTIEDGVLHIFVTYFVSVYKSVAREQNMAVIEVNQEEKL